MLVKCKAFPAARRFSDYAEEGPRHEYGGEAGENKGWPFQQGLADVLAAWIDVATADRRTPYVTADSASQAGVPAQGPGPSEVGDDDEPAASKGSGEPAVAVSPVLKGPRLAKSTSKTKATPPAAEQWAAPPPLEAMRA